MTIFIQKESSPFQDMSNRFEMQEDEVVVVRCYEIFKNDP